MTPGTCQHSRLHGGVRVPMNWWRVLGNVEASHMTPGVRQQLPTREVRSEQCVALRFARWDGKGRCSSVCCTYAPWAMTSFAACQLKLMHQFYPTTTRGWNDLQNSQPVHTEP